VISEDLEPVARDCGCSSPLHDVTEKCALSSIGLLRERMLQEGEVARRKRALSLCERTTASLPRTRPNLARSFHHGRLAPHGLIVEIVDHPTLGDGSAQLGDFTERTF
jgi:hypothetical protein